MKRSAFVTLALSGALAAGTGCGPGNRQAESDGPALTNNTYSPGYGYYHAPYRSWYPHPYNYYEPDRGYFYGGTWNSAPHSSAITASHPPAGTHGSSISRGGFGRHSLSSGG